MNIFNSLGALVDPHFCILCRKISIIYCRPSAFCVATIPILCSSAQETKSTYFKHADQYTARDITDFKFDF